MKNIYLYGASDDCRELDSDFGARAESYSNLKVNDVLVEYRFDGDWGVRLVGDIPSDWVVFPVEGNCASDFRREENAGQFLHIQIPDDSVVSVYEPDEDDDENIKWREVFKG